MIDLTSMGQRLLCDRDSFHHGVLARIPGQVPATYWWVDVQVRDGLTAKGACRDIEPCRTRRPIRGGPWRPRPSRGSSWALPAGRADAGRPEASTDRARS